VVAGLLGVTFLVAALLFWVMGTAVVVDGVSWSGWDVAGFWFMGLFLFPWFGRVLLRAAWTGRDSLQESTDRQLDEAMDVWSDRDL
jgi:hypothetical protein